MSALIVAASLATDCRRKQQAAPPVATPSVTLNHDRVPLGSPIEITYKFVVAPDARFTEDYRVFVHVLDSDEETMWNDDHNPPVPTSQWKPGQTVQYTRTIFVPVYPYVGEASIQLGLHSLKDQKRLPLAGDDAGQRSYRVARFQLAPQTDNIFTVQKDGWHQTEVAERNTTVQWNWTKKDATLAFKNPREDCVLYLETDNPGGLFNEPQQVAVKLNGEEVDRFTVTPKEAPVLHKIALSASKMGSGDTSEVQLSVDKTFVPNRIEPSSKDPRELGIRVFHAFVARTR